MALGLVWRRLQLLPKMGPHECKHLVTTSHNSHYQTWNLETTALFSAANSPWILQFGLSRTRLPFSSFKADALPLTTFIAQKHSCSVIDWTLGGSRGGGKRQRMSDLQGQRSGGLSVKRKSAKNVRSGAGCFVRSCGGGKLAKDTTMVAWAAKTAARRQ